MFRFVAILLGISAPLFSDLLQLSTTIFVGDGLIEPGPPQFVQLLNYDNTGTGPTTLNATNTVNGGSFAAGDFAQPTYGVLKGSSISSLSRRECSSTVMILT